MTNAFILLVLIGLVLMIMSALGTNVNHLAINILIEIMKLGGTIYLLYMVANMFYL